MTLPALPSLGATNWLPWASGLHNAVEDLVAGGGGGGGGGVPTPVITDGGLFVSPSGHDTDNDGLSLGAPLRTIAGAIAKAQNAGVGALIQLAPGIHTHSATDGTAGGPTTRLEDNIHIRGITAGNSSSASSTVGTVITHTANNGLPIFDSDPTRPLSACVVEDILIRGVSAGPQPAASGEHGFKLYCLTNNSALRRVTGYFLGGDVVHLEPNAGGGDEMHGLFNGQLDQVFGIGLGGYNVNILGDPIGIIRMPDGTNNRGGLLKLADGISNQAALVIEQPMWEGGTGSVSTQPILLDNMNSQAIVITGGTFAGATGSTSVIKMTTTAASPVLIGCSGYNFTNWIEDVPNSFNLAMTTRISYYSSTFYAQQFLAQGPGATMEVFNTSGTTNQRRYRWTTSGTTFVLSERNDDGTSVRDILYVNGTNGQVEIVGGFKVDGNVGFYNGTPVAKPTVSGSRGGNAALASLLTALASQGLITDSSTA